MLISQWTILHTKRHYYSHKCSLISQKKNLVLSNPCLFKQKYVWSPLKVLCMHKYNKLLMQHWYSQIEDFPMYPS
jgi:hypothetical protein